MNVWIRSPGLMTSGILAYASYQNGHNHINPLGLLFGMVLVVFNGQYYMERVVANHAVKKYAYKQTLAVQKNLTEVLKIQIQRISTCHCKYTGYCRRERSLALRYDDLGAVSALATRHARNLR